LRQTEDRLERWHIVVHSRSFVANALTVCTEKPGNQGFYWIRSFIYKKGWLSLPARRTSLADVSQRLDTGQPPYFR